MRYAIYISLFFVFSAHGQDSSRVVKDSLPVFDIIPVEVTMRLLLVRINTPKYSIIGRKEIEELQANDAGEILQKIPGVNLKSYGGLGGLKTISVRSLGSQHSAVSVDGFSIQNSQTGQVNLAQIQTNNLESIALGVGEQSGYLIPVSARIAGNNVSLQTFEMSFPKVQDTLQIRANTRIGSFGQISGYGSAKVKIKKGFISGFGNYRTSNGEYPFQIQNGILTQSSVRTNNDYQDQYYGGVIGFEVGKKSWIRINYKRSTIDQGLPGAVILYNSAADERLTTGDHSISADARVSLGKKLVSRVYVNGNSNSMRYFDPTYFNSAGQIDVTYLNRNLSAGIVGQTYSSGLERSKYNPLYYFGVEGGLSDLMSSDSLFSSPLRKQISGIFGSSLEFGPIKLIGHLSGQFVNELNANGPGGKNVVGVNPYVSLETRESGAYYIRHRIWYRNSLRVPTFNELYYNNIGNTDLDPEKANQFGYNLSFFPVDSYKRKIWITASGYFNRITDKIVAIPTQNLFTWSIQNVGIVHAFGGEATVNFNWGFGARKQFVVASSLNYSFQRSMDVSDADHPTFGHQIAYIPMHTGNADLTLSYKRFGFRTSNYLVSTRYSLNENNLANELEGFAISDVGVFYTFEMGRKQSLRVQFQLKNAFNNSYSYIRSFVMPGRNYLISINYAFN